MSLRFFVGMHHPHSARHLDLACISANVLRRRKSGFEPPASGWMLDSGAFTEISTHGCYRTAASEYAAEAARWLSVPGLEVVVSQDFMCEPHILAKTGLTVSDHQRLTIERYDEVLRSWLHLTDGTVPIMPVLQGWAVEDYVAHLRAYGGRISEGMWVGVGSICKRQGRPEVTVAILEAIKSERPDIRLHGFGVKITSLEHPRIRALLYSADSMAWSFAARYEGRDPNDPAEAVGFADRVERQGNRLLCRSLLLWALVY